MTEITTPWEAGGITKDRFVSGEGIFELGDVNIFPASGPGPVAIAAGIDHANLIVKAVNNHELLVKALADIRLLLSYAENEAKSPAVKESNCNAAWHRANSMLIDVGSPGT